MNPPLDMNTVVKAIKRRHGRVKLVPEDGLTKIEVAGVRLAFPEAEKLALGKVTLEELRQSRS
jgi:hypothetical protein